MRRWLLKAFEALSRRKFEGVFRRGPDPYRYRSLEFESRRFELMVRLLDGRRYAHALEVGCAEGLFTERLAPLASRVLALDISGAALERAAGRLKPRWPQVELVRASAADWDPAGRPPFDLVVVSEVLYYLGERNDLLKALGASKRILEGCLRRLAAALAPGGRMLLAHSYGPGGRAGREVYRTLLEGMGLRLVREEDVPPTGEPGTDFCLVSLLEKPAP